MDNKSALRMKPLIIKKGNIRIVNHTLINDRSFTAEKLFKEDVLYDTTDVYFLKGEYQRLLLVNRYNIVTKQSRTVAKYYGKDGLVIEKTSDRVTEVIGQEQFKTILTAVCSILDQELKIRSILALLTMKVADKIKTELIDFKKEALKYPIKILVENSCQTDEMRIEKVKPKRRTRKPVSPYIVPDVKTDSEENIHESQYIVPDLNTDRKMYTDSKKKTPKRIVVSVRKMNLNSGTLEKFTRQSEASVTQFEDHSQEYSEENIDPLNTLQNTDSVSDVSEVESQQCISELQTENSTTLDNRTAGLNNLDVQKNSITDLNTEKHTSDGNLDDLGYLHDDYSNDGSAKLSILSETPTNPELLTNPVAFINNIDQHTKNCITQTGYKIPGTDVIVPYKPEDMFHIATKDNLKYLDNATKQKLLQHQLQIDYKHCLNAMDEDGNLPIHLAVLNDDIELLVRQCIVLKMRGSSIDVPDNGVTALKLAMTLGRGPLVARLVRHGACPLRTDSYHRAVTHDAAEKDPDLLLELLTVCRENARKILYENEDIWKDGMDKQTDEELGLYLLNHICTMFNRQGYNPLMLACMLGLYENVRILLEHSSNVNDKMPTSGNTALHLACAAACNSSLELGHRSKLADNFRKTVEILLQNGANPAIENNYGTNVPTLIQEFNNIELTILVTSNKYQRLLNNKIPVERDVANVMLVLGKGGDIQCKNLKNERNKKQNAIVKASTDKKLVIVENVIVKPADTNDGKSNVTAKNLKSVPKVDAKKNKIPPNARKSQGVKRKLSDTPKVIKQAKID